MRRDLIVIGGSAGAVEAVLRLAPELPSDFPAAVLLVIHTSPNGAGELPGLIHRAGSLPCAEAEDCEPIRPGRIYVARPDHHLLVEDGHLRVVIGPRENRHRPAIDPLFRSAAVTHGARVIGVLLSGNLDDGSAGLALIKKQGGLAVVQDPRDAMYPGMPRNALAVVEADHVVPLRELGALLARLAGKEAATGMEPEEKDRLESGISANRLLDEAKMREVAEPSVFSCPDCGGTLFEYKDAETPRFRCSIGHGVTGLTLLAAQGRQNEEALAASFQSLLAHHRLYHRLVDDFERRGMSQSAAEMRRKSEEAARHAEVIQGLLQRMGGAA